MSNKDLGESIENFEEEIEGLKNKEFRLFGIKMTAMTISAAFAIISAGLGSLYGAFEVYKDYMEMKQQIQEYVAPDLSSINERLTALDKKMEGIAANVQQSTEYTNEIKNDLKGDIRRVEGVVESVERSNKQTQRETDISVKEVRGELRALQKETDLAIKESNANVTRAIKETNQSVDNKIKQALDNPLAN
jgi:uncharacterized protein YoxC